MPHCTQPPTAIEIGAPIARLSCSPRSARSRSISSARRSSTALRSAGERWRQTPLSKLRCAAATAASTPAAPASGSVMLCARARQSTAVLFMVGGPQFCGTFAARASALARAMT